MHNLVFEARSHYYAIEPGIDVYPEKKGMIDVQVFDSIKNKEVAMVAFNEHRTNADNAAVFWQIDSKDMQYFINVTNQKEKIKNLAYTYLKSIGLNYDK